jgi:hypothetical protein
MPLTQSELESIQADAMADDVDIDLDKMSLWSAEQARQYFESGGEVSPAEPAPPDDTPSDDTLDLTSEGKKRFATVEAKSFTTKAGVRIVYQLALGQDTPIVIIPGMRQSRHDACADYGAEASTCMSHRLELCRTFLAISSRAFARSVALAAQG